LAIWYLQDALQHLVCCSTSLLQLSVELEHGIFGHALALQNAIQAASRYIQQGIS
jgi:hypothetical protein